MAVLTLNSDKTQGSKNTIELYCWWWCTLIYQVQSQHSHLPRCFRALCASVHWQALWKLWYPFPKALGPSHRAKTSSNGCTDHGITGPANWPDLNPTEILCCIVKRKMWDIRPNHTDELKAAFKANLGFHNTSAEPRADHLHATPHWWRTLFKSILDQVLSA